MNALQEYVKDFLSAPILFLVVIGIAIYWQQMNSKKLAKEANQDEKQAMMFSWIVAISILLCVANEWMAVARLSAGIEGVVNILLVLILRSKLKMQLRMINDQLESIADKERKGKVALELNKQKEELLRRIGALATTTNIFVGVMIPTFILLLSDLYIKS